MLLLYSQPSKQKHRGGTPLPHTPPSQRWRDLRFLPRSAIVAAAFQPDDPVRVRHRPEPVDASPASPSAAALGDLFETPAEPPARDVARAAGGTLRARTLMSELRFGQMGIAQLTLRAIDPAAIWAELDAKVRAAP